MYGSCPYIHKGKVCNSNTLIEQEYCPKHNRCYYFYSVCERKWIRGKSSERGDLKLINGVMNRFDGKVWRKLCKVCHQYGWTGYCKSHNPDHVTLSSNCGFSKIASIFFEGLICETDANILFKGVDDNGLSYGYEFVIPDTNFKVDGYIQESKVVIEFLGDYWHGNPKIYERTETNIRAGKTHGELLDYTFHRFSKISELGYKILYIWESDYVELSSKNLSIFDKLTRYVHNK